MPARVIIGILAGSNETDRKSQCRMTWMLTAAQRGVQAVFLIGRPELAAAELHGDELHLPCPDAYRFLPQKTHGFCQWALTRDDWDYLFKADTDTYINVDRLLAYDCHAADYIGAPHRDRISYASGGAGYLLSRKAAAILAEKMVQSHGAEDMIVGSVLQRNGIVPTWDKEAFIPWGSMDARPKADNRAVTTHAVGRDVFEACHAEFSL
jgi:hypothetical protein